MWGVAKRTGLCTTTVPRQKPPCERIFKIIYSTKLLYNNHIINFKALRVFQIHNIYKL